VNFNVEQNIFVVFYAIVWGLVANVQPKWKAFQLPLLNLKHVRYRVLLAFVTFNILPLIFFGYIIWALRVEDLQAYKTSIILIVIHGIVPAFAIFGFYRLWLGIIELWPDSFYVSTENRDSKLEEKKRYVEPTYSYIYEEKCNQKDMPVIYLGDTRSGLINMLFALLYIIVSSIVPWFGKCS
jgi:hypothetical protein